METAQRELSEAKAANASLSASLEAETQHSADLETDLKTATAQRVEMAKTCLAKDEEVSQMRRQHQQSEEKNGLLEEKNLSLLQEVVKLRETGSG